MKKFTSEEIKEFVSKPVFNEKIILNKDSSWPEISIVTPSYNQAEFLERTILSVFNQNYPNLNYIIIDGGSTDGSVEVIKKYEQFLTYWISEPDKGQADAIEKGFLRSKGKILAYINSDDTYLPGALFKIAKAFSRNNEADFVFGNAYIINAYDNLVAEFLVTKFSFSSLIYEGWCPLQPATFWRRIIWEKIGGIDPEYRFCMDYDFFCRAAVAGSNFINIREYIATTRIHKYTKRTTIGSIGQIEYKEIAKRYMPNNVSNAYLKYRRVLSEMRRFFLHMSQGDLNFILKSLKRRLLRYINPK